MAAQWEYTVVEFPHTADKTRERERTELLNRVAAHGWRLVAVTPDAGNYDHTYAYFERSASTSG